MQISGTEPGAFTARRSQCFRIVGRAATLHCCRGLERTRTNHRQYVSKDKYVYICIPLVSYRVQVHMRFARRNFPYIPCTFSTPTSRSHRVSSFSILSEFRLRAVSHTCLAAFSLITYACDLMRVFLECVASCRQRGLKCGAMLWRCGFGEEQPTKQHKKNLRTVNCEFTCGKVVSGRRHDTKAYE